MMEIPYAVRKHVLMVTQQVYMYLLLSNRKTITVTNETEGTHMHQDFQL